jgi:antitoxin VapB
MKTAKLFLNGQSQAVRLPKEFRFSGNEVFVKRLGKAVLLIPIEDGWDTLIQSLDAFSPDFMSERNQPPHQNREPIEP